MVTLEITRGDGVIEIARTCRACFVRGDRLPTIVVPFNWSVIGTSVRGSAARDMDPQLIWIDLPPAKRDFK